jgi:TPR repeat protein
MKQLLIGLTLLTLSANLASASNPFQSMVIREHSNHIVITKEVKASQNSKFFYAQRAAKQGNVQAKYDLAMMYALGKGVERDRRKAFNLFHEAARKGHAKAKYCVAVNFEKGLGVKPQAELARYWYKLAAKAGNTQAIVKLANLKKLIKKQKGRAVYASN